VPDAGGPYTVGEGSPLTLDGSGTVAPAGATFAWDVDNDGQFDDATGATPTVSAATLATLGLGDGPAGPITVTLQVSSPPTVRTDTTTLTVTNVAPGASVLDVPSGAVAGTPVTVTFGATDPSAADTTAGFTYAITWGDGSSVQTVTGGSSVAVDHTYATAATFTVSVTATDKDGGISAPATSSVGVNAAVVADAGGPYTVAEGGLGRGQRRPVRRRHRRNPDGLGGHAGGPRPGGRAGRAAHRVGPGDRRDPDGNRRRHFDHHQRGPHRVGVGHRPGDRGR
jgi:hypothetical protein